MTSHCAEGDRLGVLDRVWDLLDRSTVTHLIESATDETLDWLTYCGVHKHALRLTADPARWLRRRFKMLDGSTRVIVALALTRECNDRLDALLGERAPAPSVEDLRRVLPVVVSRHGASVVALLFAAYAASAARCSVACAELLETEAVFASEPTADGWDEMPEDAPAETGDAAADGDRAEVKERRSQRRRDRKEARRRRREQEAAREEERRLRLRAGRAPADAGKSGAPGGAAAALLVAEGAASPPAGEGEQRRLRPKPLIRRYRVPFRVDASEVGTVVVAEIPFHDDGGAKRRPAVIVAVGDYAFVVRACYSEDGLRARDWRSVELVDWKEAGLDRPTYVATYETVVSKSKASRVLGVLSERDWNTL